MSARDDYRFPAAVADGRVGGGAYGQPECARALDELDRLRAEVERVRPVIDAAAARVDAPITPTIIYHDAAIIVAVRNYRAAVAALDAGEPQP